MNPDPNSAQDLRGGNNAGSANNHTPTHSGATTTRIFDVYAGETGMPSHMIDVLACDGAVGAGSAGQGHGQSFEEDDDTDSAEEYEYERRGGRPDAGRPVVPLGAGAGAALINTGRAHVQVDVQSDTTAVEHDQRRGLQRPARLDIARPEYTEQQQLMMPLQQSQPPLTNTDIWSVPVENAFLAALRIILKKGTAKIKLKDRNYGRNELISLYIHHRVGEYRAKKQISSHIQVWKKSILNKLQNGTNISTYEKELLDLIEHGAPQTPENERVFHAIFGEILDAPNILGRHGSSVSTSSSTSPSNPQFTGPEPMITPHGVPTPHLPHAHVYDSRLPSAAAISAPPPYFPYSGNPALVSMPGSLPGSATTEPLTPIEYARRVYGKLPSYKCVPVNMHDYAYQYADSGTPTDSDQHTLQAAQEVAAQQRQLIHNLYSSQHVYSAAPPADYAQDQAEYTGYDRHSFVPPNAAQPPEQSTHEQLNSQYPSRSSSSEPPAQEPQEEH